MTHRTICLLITVSFLVVTLPGSAQRLSVQSAGQLRSALSAATPGTTITITASTLDAGGEIVISRGGTPGSPVVLEAKTIGGTTLEGATRFIIRKATDVVIRGFDFAGTKGPAILIDGSSRVRVTRNTFHLRESERSNWVMITGRSGGNRIDHNLFENKSHLGNFITIEGENGELSRHDTVDLNHFREIGPRVENFQEAIRAGGSEFSLSSGFTLLEHNLFERCDADPEYLSVKASDCTIRGNTFRECLGSLSLRHGNRNRVEGNFILGNGRTGEFVDSTGKKWRLGTGGLRFYGDSMVIVDNYLEGLTGTRWDAVFAITNGNADYGEGLPLTKHYRIRDAVIASNTFVGNDRGIEIGYDGEGFQGNWWHRVPQGLTFERNLFVGDRDTLVRMFDRPERTTWRDNVAWATGTCALSAVPLEGFASVDPLLRRVGGVLRPSRDGLEAGAHVQGTGGEIFVPLVAEDVGPFADELRVKARSALALAQEQLSRSARALSPSAGFPRTANGKKWQLVPPTDWTSGFFPGCLWLMYATERDTAFRRWAEEWTAALEAQQFNRLTHDVGFMMMCSFGNGLRLAGTEGYRPILLQAASSLATRFNPKIGCIKSWESRPQWPYPVIIDNMMNLELLFWGAKNGGSPSLREIATTHALTTIANHFRPDGSTYHVVDYDTATGKVRTKQTHQGYADESVWARGQAWALYGFTMTFRETGDERFLAAAQRAADWFIGHLPIDGVPYWDFKAPGIPDEARDAAAGAIAASGLLELAPMTADREKGAAYRRAAERTLASLCSPAYLARSAEDPSILRHATGNLPGGSEVDVPLIYADYYFLEAILRYLNSER